MTGALHRGWARWVDQPWVDQPWWQRAGLAMTSALPVLGAWRARGALVGSIALLVFPPMVGAWLFAPRHVQRWSRRHPILDGLLVVPLMFLALAVIARLSLWVCLLVAS